MINQPKKLHMDIFFFSRFDQPIIFSMWTTWLYQWIWFECDCLERINTKRTIIVYNFYWTSKVLTKSKKLFIAIFIFIECVLRNPMNYYSFCKLLECFNKAILSLNGIPASLCYHMINTFDIVVHQVVIPRRKHEHLI